MYEKELKQYCRRAHACLRCDRTQKAAFSALVRQGADEVLAEQPDADFSAVEAVLGSPEAAAAAFMETLPLDTPARWQKRQRNLLQALAAVVLLLTLVTVLLAYRYGIHIITIEQEIGSYEGDVPFELMPTPKPLL